MNATTLTHWASTAPAWQLTAVGIVTLAALAAAAWLATVVRRLLAGHDLADVITGVIALAATGYAATGTWKYLTDAMHYGVDLKAVLVAVLEGAQIAEALRARKNIKESGTAGVDGVGLWVLTGISAALSTSVAGNVREALGRAIIPAVGAWLWERALAPQRRAARVRKAKGPIRWRITPERVAVWLRLADAVDTDVVTVDSARRVAGYLKATDRQARPKLLRVLTLADARAYRRRMKLIGDALRHGDPSEVHERLSDAAFTDALKRLGIAKPEGASVDASAQSPDDASKVRTQTASVAGSPLIALPQSRRIRTVQTSASRRAAEGASDARVREAALKLDRETIAETGLPAGLRQLQRELGIGQARATELRAWLAAQRELSGTAERVNGHA
jgi:hypothetical protein